MASLGGADENLEANRFAEARDEFREAMAAAAPEERHFSNLELAERLDCIAELKKVALTYPNSSVVQRRFARALSLGRFHKQAADVCTEALKVTTDQLEVFKVRLLRMEESLADCSFESAAEDFTFCWQAAEKLAPGKFIGRFAGTIAGLSRERDAEFIDLLTRLPANASLRELLAAKATELAVLRHLCEMMHAKPASASEASTD
jgi:hypothetical protein